MSNKSLRIFSLNTEYGKYSSTLVLFGDGNLIMKYGIKNTRTSVYNEPSLPFIDYAFVVQEISIENLRVYLESIFSDHEFMILDVSI